MTAYETGTLYSASHPAGQRAYYEQMLLETLRTKSILVPFCQVKEQFAARDTGQMVYTEVLDTDPNFNALSESGIWLTGAHLDSRSVNITLEIHGDVIKVSDYNELVNFWANGDLRGLVKGKLGQNMVDYLDLLARNAFLSSPYKAYSGSGNTDRFGLLQTDVFNPETAELMRVHLEEREIPGVSSELDGGSAGVLCITTPRVCHDIRTAAGSAWIDVQNYNKTGRKFNSEVGQWGGVRFIKTNRLALKNYGVVAHQSTLAGATVPGQGAYATVDTVYTPGQSGSTRYITAAAADGFAVGDVVTIHSEPVAVSDGAGGYAPVETDGTQETRRVIWKDNATERIAFDKPLLKAHASGDYITKGITVHASIFVGGPAVVYGVGERPHPLVLPKIDDLGMIQRFSWRGFLKFQMFRPEFIEVVESGGSVN